MKQILSKKKKLKEFEIMTLNDECSALLEETTPKVEGYREGFIIPYLLDQIFHAKSFVI